MLIMMQMMLIMMMIEEEDSAYAKRHKYANAIRSHTNATMYFNYGTETIKQQCSSTETLMNENKISIQHYQQLLLFHAEYFNPYSTV